MTDEAELSAFPIVQIEAKPGQPTLIDPEAPSFAMTQSLASVKTLILGGFGVGAMLNYMLVPADREQLVHAAIPHDPNCGLWIIRRPEFDGGRALEIEETLCEAVTLALAQS